MTKEGKKDRFEELSRELRNKTASSMLEIYIEEMLDIYHTNIKSQVENAKSQVKTLNEQQDKIEKLEKENAELKSKIEYQNKLIPNGTINKGDD